jgi:hypothetical protein
MGVGGPSEYFVSSARRNRQDPPADKAGFRVRCVNAVKLIETVYLRMAITRSAESSSEILKRTWT